LKFRLLFLSSPVVRMGAMCKINVVGLLGK